MDSVGAVFLDLNLNTSGFTRQLNGIQSTVNKSGGLSSSLLGLGKAVGVAFSIGALVSFGKAAIKLGSDLNEVQNVVNVTFGQGAGVIDEFAKSAKSAFGLSELAAKQYTGTMGAMLKSMGFSSGSASEMSTTLAGLAGDMASFYNLTSDEAFSKLRSGMSGETEPLKQLGINLSVANLEAFALSKGIRTAYSEMNQSNQALLRYEYLLKTTSAAQGDFTRTSGSWANQTRLLSLQWDSFKASMGQGFINMLTPVLKGLNTLMGKLVTLGEMFRNLTAQLFGDASDSIEEVATTTEDAGDSMGNLAGGIGKVGKATRGILAPFDKLNVLTQALGSAGGSSGSIVKVATTTKKAADNTNKLAKKFEDVNGPVVDIVNNLNEMGGKVWTNGMSYGFTQLEKAWNNVLGISSSVLTKYNDLTDWAEKHGVELYLTPQNFGREFARAGDIIQSTTGLLNDLLNGNAVGSANNFRTLMGTIFDPAVEDMNLLEMAWYNIQHPVTGPIITFVEQMRDTYNTFARLANKVAGKTFMPIWEYPGGGYYWGTEDGVPRGGVGSRGTDTVIAPGGYGGGTGTVRPISRIPQMAEGGIVTRPTLALIGEKPGSSEAVIPLDKLGQYAGGMGGGEVLQELKAMNRRLANLESGSVQVYIDGVFERQVEFARRMNTRAGRVVIPVGAT